MQSYDEIAFIINNAASAANISLFDFQRVHEKIMWN